MNREGTVAFLAANLWAVNGGYADGGLWHGPSQQSFFPRLQSLPGTENWCEEYHHFE
jgi:hypothetical protein